MSGELSGTSSSCTVVVSLITVLYLQTQEAVKESNTFDYTFTNVNVNVSVYSLKSPLSSADFTIYAPGIGTLSYTVSSPLGRIQHLRTLLQL